MRCDIVGMWWSCGWIRGKLGALVAKPISYDSVLVSFQLLVQCVGSAIHETRCPSYGPAYMSRRFAHFAKLMMRHYMPSDDFSHLVDNR
jgi:hypothetical protein